VLRQWRESSGVEGVPPLAMAECELLERAELDESDEESDFELEEDGAPDEQNLIASAPPSEYTPTTSSATTQGVTVRVRRATGGAVVFTPRRRPPPLCLSVLYGNHE
jgi:hypothetical protein